MPTLVQQVYGPMFIGMMFNVLLYGVMFTQTYLYFTMYKDDRTWIKVFVFVLFLCDTANTGFDIAIVYDPLINNFGNVHSLNEATWMFSTDPALTAVIAALVQFFFAWRVKVLTSNHWIVGGIVLCAITQLLGGLGCTIALGMVSQFYNFRKFQVIGIIWLVAATLADVSITAALVWHLRKHKSGMSVTDNLVDKIIHLTVQTGLITTLFAMINLTLYLAIPSRYDMMFNMPLAKLYTNSLMSTLNSRRTLIAAASNGSESRGHIAQRSGVNVNIPRGERGGRKSIRASERIVIGAESYQLSNLANDEHYLPSMTSFISDQKMV